MISILIVSALISVMYAAIIYKRTVKPQWVWLSVVIGDGLYDVSFGLLLYEAGAGNCFLGNWIVAAPFLMHVLWGGPMIAFDVAKHYKMIAEAMNIQRPGWGSREWD